MALRQKRIAFYEERCQYRVKRGKLILLYIDNLNYKESCLFVYLKNCKKLDFDKQILKSDKNP